MVNILKILIIALYELLPTSPFPVMFDSALANADFLAYLNWFLPFDICANIMLAWLDCIILYYVFVIVKKLLFDVILSNIVSSGSGSFWFFWRHNS